MKEVTKKLADSNVKIILPGWPPEIGKPTFLIDDEGTRHRAPEGRAELEGGEIIHIDKSGLLQSFNPNKTGGQKIAAEAHLHPAMRARLIQMSAQDRFSEKISSILRQGISNVRTVNLSQDEDPNISVTAIQMMQAKKKPDSNIRSESSQKERFYQVLQNAQNAQ